MDSYMGETSHRISSWVCDSIGVRGLWYPCDSKWTTLTRFLRRELGFIATNRLTPAVNLSK